MPWLKSTSPGSGQLANCPSGTFKLFHLYFCPPPFHGSEMKNNLSKYYVKFLLPDKVYLFPCIYFYIYGGPKRVAWSRSNQSVDH